MYPAPAPRAYYPALDILRGIAILAVVFFHNFGSLRFFGFGWMGVDLFFVLSGFLITELLLSSLGNRYYFRNFFMRRVLRIFPLYYAVLLLFFLASPMLFKQKDPQSTYAYFNDNKLWFWTYFQNWLMVKKGPAPVPYLTHFWSLGVEEQFYIFWPFVLFCFRRLSHLKTVVVALILFAIGFRLFTWFTHPYEVEAYYCNTLTRMDSLLMGCLLAVHLKEGKTLSKAFIKNVVMCFGLLITTSLVFYGNLKRENFLFSTIGYSLTAAFFAVVLYCVLHHSHKLTASLKRLTALQFIGKISYGIYVFHVPVYLLLATQVSKAVGEFVSDAGNVALLVSVLSLLLTIAISTLSFYLFEKPILTLKKHFP